MGVRKVTTGERKKFVLSWIAGVIGFIIVTLSLCTEDTSGEYLERGQKVEATITKVVLNKAYYGVYVDSNGKQVQAEILPNNFSSGVGTVVEGYYLPEEPNKVWCEPSKGLLIALDCLTWFFEIVLGLGVFDFVLLLLFGCQFFVPRNRIPINERFGKVSAVNTKDARRLTITGFVDGVDLVFFAVQIPNSTARTIPRTYPTLIRSAQGSCSRMGADLKRTYAVFCASLLLRFNSHIVRRGANVHIDIRFGCPMMPSRIHKASNALCRKVFDCVPYRILSGNCACYNACALRV